MTKKRRSSLSESLRTIADTTEIELAVEVAGTKAAQATARVVRGSVTAMVIALIGVAVYWIIEIIACHKIYNGRPAAFLLDRVDEAHAIGEWPVNGLGTCLALRSGFVRNLLFSNTRLKDYGLDALQYLFLNTMTGANMNQVMLEGPLCTPPNTAICPQLTFNQAAVQSIVALAAMVQDKTEMSSAELACHVVKDSGLYSCDLNNGICSSCNDNTVCMSPPNQIPDHSTMDGVSAGMQTGMGLAMGAMMLPGIGPFIGIAAAIAAGTTIGVYTAKGARAQWKAQKGGCPSGCNC